MSTMTPTASALATPTTARRSAAGLTLFSVLVTAIVAGQAIGPMLVRTLRIDGSTAEKIARAVDLLGSVPWWALLIIGGGIAGTLLRLVVRYGWRYAAAW